MSYKVLARKWRPQRFDDMLGQEHVLKALSNALDTQRLHHAYLFTGTRGVGKTTIARIFCKCLNCHTNGVSASPCGTCSACQDIDAGRFFDLIEVDAASRTKVDETRELLENVPYAPSSGRYKVYLIDEVHMFSTASFNALLKTLEEPPEHVKFLLATTDPQKVPVTVLSRCLQFNLKRMANRQLSDYLDHILTEENMPHDAAALDLIAKAAEGSVRDSLSLVEQAAAYGNGEVRETDVESMLGRVSTERLIGLLESIAENNAPELFEQVAALAEYAPDFSQLLADVLSLLHQIAMLQTVPGASDNMNVGAERLHAMATSMPPDEVQLLHQIGVHARRDMPFVPDQGEAFDMTLLRMLAFKPQPPGSTGHIPTPEGGTVAQPPASSANAKVAAIPTQTAPSESTSAQSTSVPSNPAPILTASISAEAHAVRAEPATAGAPTNNAPTAGQAGVKKPVSLSSARAEALAAAGALAEKKTPDSVTVKPADNAESSATQAAPAPSTYNGSEKPAASTGAAVESSANVASKTSTANSPAAHAGSSGIAKRATSDFDASKDNVSAAGWPNTVNHLQSTGTLAGMPLEFANNCVPAGCSGTTLTLQLSAAVDQLASEHARKRLVKALHAVTGTEYSLNIELVEHALDTPAKQTAARAEDNLQAARDSIEQDPFVRELVSSVDGVVDASSVQPLTESDT